MSSGLSSRKIKGTFSHGALVIVNLHAIYTNFQGTLTSIHDHYELYDIHEADFIAHQFRDSSGELILL